MENLALIESFSQFKDDKLIDRVTLMSILEEVFRNTRIAKHLFQNGHEGHTVDQFVIFKLRERFD